METKDLCPDTIKFLVKSLIRDIKESQKEVKDSYTALDSLYCLGKTKSLIEQKIKFEKLRKKVRFEKLNK